jgi:hypothetical protein
MCASSKSIHAENTNPHNQCNLKQNNGPYPSPKRIAAEKTNRIRSINSKMGSLKLFSVDIKKDKFESFQASSKSFT